MLPPVLQKKIVLCNAAQPVIDARALVEEACTLGLSERLLEHRLESGGEDMPNAYRTVPCAPEDLSVNITAIYDPKVCAWRFQEMWSLMFGYSSGVVNFNRWAKFLEAMVRRIGSVLWTMYYDDGSIRDLAVGRGSAQLLVKNFFSQVGAPLADKKRQIMSSSAVFLGLHHDVSHALSHGTVTFWPRDGLVEKIITRINEILRSDVCTSGQASKLLGLLGFTSTGMWGRIGKVGTASLILRTRPSRRSKAVDNDLIDSLDFVLQLLQLEPRRVALVRPPPSKHVVVATDAQADSAPTGGFLLMDPQTGAKRGGCFKFGQEFLDLVGFPEAMLENGNPIAQCEAAAVVVMLLACLDVIVDRDVLLFVDNTSALHCFVKGLSRNGGLARSVQVGHLLSLHVRARVWFEYVPSVQNWADGVSRQGVDDPWAKEHAFPVRHLVVPIWPWQGTLHQCMQSVLSLGRG